MKKAILILIFIILALSSFAQAQATRGEVVQWHKIGNSVTPDKGSIPINSIDSLRQKMDSLQQEIETGSTDTNYVKNAIEDSLAGVVKKTVANTGSLWLDGSTGATPASGAGTRLMWIPSKSAFRAGSVSSSQWDDANIGEHSSTFGSNNTASGSSSTALGGGTVASGGSAISMGSLTTASANGSTATGISTIASGVYSFSMGYGTTASAASTLAANYNTTASGIYSSSFGVYTLSECYASFALGRYNVGGGNVSAWASTDPLFEIGIGTSVSARANAFTVYKNGNATLSGVFSASNIGTIASKDTSFVNKRTLDSLNTIRALSGSKVDTSASFPLDTTGAGVLGANNRLYLNTTKDTIKIGANSGGVTASQVGDTANVIRAESKVTAHDTATAIRAELASALSGISGTTYAYDGAFTGTDKFDTLVISGANSYDSYTVTPYMSTDADTSTLVISVRPKKDTVIVSRAYGGTSGRGYTVHRIPGTLAQSTNIDVQSSTSTSLKVLWTKPTTSATTTARSIDTAVIAYSKANGYSTLAAYGDSVKNVVGTSQSDSLTSLTATTRYHVKIFSKTYSDESLVSTSWDTCTTGAVAAGRANYLKDSLHIFLAFDESSGNASDASGNGNTFTNNNSTPYVAGLLGNCVRVDSANARNFSQADNYWNQFGDRDYTIAVWVMMKNPYTTAGSIFGKNNEVRLYHDAFDETTFRAYVGTSTVAGTVVGGSSMTDTTTWHLFVMMHKQSVDSLYISYDGGAWTQAATTVTPGLSAAVCYIGALSSSASTRISALIDNFMVWGRNLTDAEKNLLYNGRAGRAYSYFE